MKIGRNDLCPCGSNKKYKKCCMNKINEYSSVPQEASFMEYQGTPNLATSALNDIKDILSTKEFSSIDDINNFMSQATNDMNSKPITDFHGLSSSQMRQIMHSDIFSYNDVAQFNWDLPNKDFENMLIIKDSLFFLNLLKENSFSIPLTSSGYIPLKYCDEFLLYKYNYKCKDINIRSEAQIYYLTLIRNLLEMAGYIDVLKTKINMTSKGFDTLQSNSLNPLFKELFICYMSKYDWLYDTSSTQDSTIIQQTALFSLFLLHKLASNFTPYYNIYSNFLKAFPMIDKITPYEYNKIFIDYFCSMFNLIETKENGNQTNSTECKTSTFFNKFIIWKIK